MYATRCETLPFIYLPSHLSHRNLNEKAETPEESERIKRLSKAVSQQAPPRPSPHTPHSTPLPTYTPPIPSPSHLN